MKLHPHIHIILNTDERLFGPGNYRLLKLIDETGSLSKACMMMDLSYSKGYKMVKAIERKLGYPLVKRRAGGKDGGGSSLSDEGRKLVENYDLLQQSVEKYTEMKFKEIFEGVKESETNQD